MSRDADSQRHEQNDPVRSRRARRSRRGGGVVFGLVLLAAGTLFLLDNIGVLDARQYYQWWPLALIVIGISELTRGSRLGAAIWMAFGGWFLLHNFDFLGVNPFQIFWPVLWIIVGSILVWQALTQTVSGGRGGGSNRMSAFALMAGNVQRSSAGPVDSVQATAIMGGCEIDLRKMTRGESPTVVDLFAMWGGIEITIPEGWALEQRATPILAGVEDRTAPAAPGAPKVILRGTVVMGGVEVRN